MPTVPSFIEANESFEKWLRARIAVVEEDLETKHSMMADAIFPFLRATYFRWAQVWPILCPELVEAPKVLAVADLHVENFGTWRDADSRLVWGINDFDEAFQLPFTSDLVRLAVSACLAVGAQRLDNAGVCTAILDGYKEGLARGGCPFLLAEQNKMLRLLAQKQIKNAKKFWAKLRENQPPTYLPPAEAVALLEKSLPEPGFTYQLLHRTAGLGSLGRKRLVALTSWRGGYLAREVKPVLPSAHTWAFPQEKEPEPLVARILEIAVRCPDAAVKFGSGWMVRRLAPDCVKIEVKDSESDRDLLLPAELPALLGLMGAETANVHLGSPGAGDILRLDLEQRSVRNKRWFEKAVLAMLEQIDVDFKEWKKYMKKVDKAAGKPEKTDKPDKPKKNDKVELIPASEASQ